MEEQNKQQELTKEQALNDLYKAVRSINTTADAHDYLNKCAIVIQNYFTNSTLTEKETAKK